MNGTPQRATTPPVPRIVPPPPGRNDPFADLLAYLADMHADLKDLADLSGTKLAALRQADTVTLQACAAREEELLKRVLLAERRRDALLARAAQHLHCPELATRGLSALEKHLAEPQTSILRARRAALRDVAADLQRKNQVAAAVARHLQEHIRGIFADVAKVTQESLVYGARGQPETSTARCWVDAVG